MKDILIFIVSLIHLLLILFVIIGPFINIPVILLLHIVYTLCIITHWYYNNSICCLTVLEGYLRNVDYKDTFIHRIVNPIYNISENKLNKIIWIVTIIMLGISMYKIGKYLYSLEDWPGIKNLLILKWNNNL